MCDWETQAKISVLGGLGQSLSAWPASQGGCWEDVKEEGRLGKGMPAAAWVSCPFCISAWHMVVVSLEMHSSNRFLLLPRSASLAQVNAMLREQLEQANTANQALSEDIRKLAADWSKAREELEQREGEWRREKEVWGQGRSFTSWAGRRLGGRGLKALFPVPFHSW